ncbi:MAG TPA: ECF-type sigma factor [Terriglobales bacterium]
MEPTISSLVEAIKRGKSAAAEPLFAALYSELHRVANGNSRDSPAGEPERHDAASSGLSQHGRSMHICSAGTNAGSRSS